MIDLNEQHIAERILAAPGWARLGITEPRPELRAAAAGELARAILGQASPALPLPASDRYANDTGDAAMFGLALRPRFP